MVQNLRVLRIAQILQLEVLLRLADTIRRQRTGLFLLVYNKVSLFLDLSLL